MDDSQPSRISSLLELLGAALPTGLEDAGWAVIAFYISAQAASLISDRSQGMKEMRQWWEFFKEYRWGLVGAVFVSVIRAHLAIRSRDAKRIAELDNRSKPILEITLETKLDAFHSLHYFRGRIKNVGDSVEGLKIKLAGLVDNLASALLRGDVASAAEMDLAWKNGSVGPMDIDHGREEVFTIASVVPKDPPELHFTGMKDGRGASTNVGPGKYYFELHITGFKMQEIVRHVEIDLAARFDKNCVKIIKG